jgi:4-amino-4-deoxy-L-arabinose transferase-like glycosyltransferase
VRFLDKPPLAFWAMAASFKLFGVSERAARLPSAIAILGTALVLYLLARRSLDEFGSLTAGLAFILSAGTLFFTFESFPDIFLVLFLTLSVFFFLSWVSDEGNQWWAIPLLFASVAGAALAKSLIGIVFPVITIVAFVLLSKNRPRVRLRYIVLGVLIFLALSVPWHAAAAIRNPGFLDHYFVNEQLLRFIGKRQPIDYGSIPVPLFWLLLIVWFFPWSAFLPAAIRFKPDGEARRLSLMAWCWAGVILGFFTFSSRLEHYSFPALPAFSLLVAVVISRNYGSRIVNRSFTTLGVLGALCVLFFLSGLVWLAVSGPQIFNSAAAVSRNRAYTNLFSPLFELNISTRARLVVPLMSTLGVFASGFAGAWWMNRAGRRGGAVVVLAVMMTCFSWLALYSLNICADLLSSKQFGVALKNAAFPGEKVVIVGDYESANSISFYAPVQLLVYTGSAPSLEQGLKYEDAPKMILGREALDTLWKSTERVFLLCAREKLSELPIVPNSTILEDAGRVLASNK